MRCMWSTNHTRQVGGCQWTNARTDGLSSGTHGQQIEHQSTKAELESATAQVESLSAQLHAQQVRRC